MFSSLALLMLSLATLSLAAPSSQEYHMFPRVRVPQSHFEVLKMRQNVLLNPRAVTDVECIDRTAHIVFHDQNDAELSICGGIAESVTKCHGSPTETIGKSGSALFTLKPINQGATINIDKRRWEQCVRAARAVCPTGSFSARCIGGASSGDVGFKLLPS
ncbi:hypothetical protein OQA88_3820 [Cercophora sp. LCS_1]